MEPQSGTAVWKVREYLYNEQGAKVATFLRQPKSAIMDCRRMVVEIANEWLYDPQIISIVETILGVFPCVSTGMPRVDICLDAQLDDHAEKVVEKIVNGDVYKTASQQAVIWFTQKKKQRFPHQISWGAPESTFHWKLYNKYKEIYQEGYCSKPYIVAQWEALGMKPNKVWRLECSIADTPKLKVSNGDIQRQLVWQDAIEHRVHLFLDLYNNRFVLRRNEGHSNKSRDSREYLWGLEQMQTIVGYKERQCQRSTDSERRLLRKLYQEYSKQDKSNVVIGVLEQSIGTLLQKPELMRMYMQMSGLGLRDIHMRFPISLNVPSEASNWQQFEIPFLEYRHSERDVNAVDYEELRVAEHVEQLIQSVEQQTDNQLKLL